MMTNPVSHSPLFPGLQDPVHQSQSVFRKVLRAMSRPGTLVCLDEIPDPPVPLHPATAASLLSLADMDTPIWIASSEALMQVRRFLTFHTGAPCLERGEKAVFAVLPDGSVLPDLDQLSTGSPERPDKSATLIIQVQSIDPSGNTIRLSGPGIQETVSLQITGLNPSFFHWFAANHDRYPLGLDCLLTSGRQLLGLPRSVCLQREEGKCT